MPAAAQREAAGALRQGGDLLASLLLSALGAARAAVSFLRRARRAMEAPDDQLSLVECSVCLGVLQEPCTLPCGARNPKRPAARSQRCATAAAAQLPQLPPPYGRLP